jgi:protein-S-isoprenylcysteine O-methyltransferase Ste14
MRRGDLIGATAFALIAGVNGVVAAAAIGRLAGEPGVHGAALATFAVLRAAIVLAFAWFTLARGPSRSASRDPLALLACVAAVGGLMALRPPSGSASLAPLLIGDLVATVAAAWLLASILTLGTCFGILPEARGLVTRGPYSLVRHPVYLGEVALCAGLAIAAFRPWNVALLAIVAASQWSRARFEEQALTTAFSDYRAYAEATPAFLPRLGRRPAHTLALHQPLTSAHERNLR